MAKKLDLDELLDKGERIYVRNTAQKAGLHIVIQMRDAQGKGKGLQIPNKPFPVDVSARHSADDIRSSQDLRICLSKGVIELLDPKAARMELETSEVASQVESYNMSIYADRAPASVARDQIAQLRTETAPVVHANDLLQKLKAKGFDTQDVNPRVQALLGSLGSKESTSKEVLSSFNTMRDGLTEADLTYILLQAKDESMIKKFAEETLAELSGSPEQPFDN